MQGKKKYIIILLFFPFGLFAQMDLDTLPFNNNETQTLKPAKKTDFQFSAGTGFTIMGKYGSFSNIYFSPAWTYKMSPRLNFRTGALINYTPYSSVPSGLFSDNYNETSQISAPPIGVMLFTEGNYLLSSRLTITGRAYKEILPSYKPYLNPAYNYKMQGVSVGFDYKIFKNVSVGARFNYSNTPGYLNNSFFNPAYDNYIW